MTQQPEWDKPHNFVVTWDPKFGLPLPILKLFKFRSEIIPGRAILATDMGHATYYKNAVVVYLEKYHPQRQDIGIEIE